LPQSAAAEPKASAEGFTAAVAQEFPGAVVAYRSSFDSPLEGSGTNLE
jgi:hypothetical protein